MTLRVGEKAPEFDVVSSSGKSLKLSDFAGKKNVVLYFYPGDFTPDLHQGDVRIPRHVCAISSRRTPR